MFRVDERRKSKHKIGGTKVSEVGNAIKYFVNPKIENEAFGKCVNLVWISEIFHALLVKIFCQK